MQELSVDVGEIDFVAKKRKEILNCERNLVANAVEIGRHLYELSQKSVDLKAFIQGGSHSFSYERGIAFKRFYEESVIKANVASDIASEIGVDKTLELVRPLKSETNDFLIHNPVEKVKKMSKGEIRTEVKRFKGETYSPTRDKVTELFSDAELALRDVVGRFEGISVRYPDQFKGWEGRRRVNELWNRLGKVL